MKNFRDGVLKEKIQFMKQKKLKNIYKNGKMYYFLINLLNSCTETLHFLINYRN